MKELTDVRSNGFFKNENETGALKLNAALELVLLYFDGRDYKVVSDKLKTNLRLNEVRLIVSSTMLQELITQLQFHQKKLEVFDKNAKEINSLFDLSTVGRIVITFTQCWL